MDRFISSSNPNTMNNISGGCKENIDSVLKDENGAKNSSVADYNSEGHQCLEESKAKDVEDFNESKKTNDIILEEFEVNQKSIE